MQTALPLTHIRFALFLVLALAATLLVKTAPHVAGAHAAFTGKPLPAPQWQSAFDFRVGASFYDRMLISGHDRARESGPASNLRNTNMLTLDCPNSFTVDDPGDTADASAGNGICANSSGKCTLRAAIEEANALTSCSPLTINFSVTGTITLATALPDLNHPNLTISGPGAASLTVQRSTASGTAEFRVFTINSGKVMAISGLTISNGKFSGTDSGSGILNGGTLSLTDCVVSGNTGASFGGGILSYASLTVTRCTISGNTATAGGGGISASSTFVMSDSTVSGNTGDIQGGGLELERVTATLTNCTISGNTAVYGGGIHSLGISGNSNLLTMDNCTITENTGSEGAGIRTNGVAGVISVTTRLKNTLVANNTGKNFVTNGPGAVLILESNDLDSDGTSRATSGVKGNLIGTAAKKINALLSPLGNYGGTTQTHALLPGSPAINAGTSSGAPAGDQRGNSRIGAVDIGAFESQGFTLAFSGGNNQSATISTAFATALAVSVSSSFGEPVSGGQVTFTQPASGASATITGSPASLNASGQASVTARAGSTAGSYNVAASASGAPSVNFSLTNTCQTITVTAPATNTGTAGAAFSAAFTQSGGIGATTFSTASTLPTGITLSTAGALAGTPTQSGTFPITVTATDANGCTGTAGYTLTINCQTIAVTTPAINTGTAGAGFSQTFTQTGGSGTTTFSTSSALPTGITLSNTGLLAGTTNQTGSFPLVIKATDSNGCTGSVSYTLTIGCPAITVTPPAINNGTVGTAFSQTFTQTGGTAGTAFGIGSTGSTLPAGLTLSSAGALSGTPAQTGTFSIIVKATDTNGCAGTVSYTLTIGCPAITVTAPAANSAILGVAFSQTFTQSGGSGTTTFGTASSLPTGLTLSTGGALSGTPTLSGTFPITITATDSNGCAGTASYTLTVGCASSLMVSDPGDTADASPGNGVCADSNGNCTLRAAIQEANALTACSPLTINFSITETITLATALPSLNHPNLTISGPGANSLAVQRSTAGGTPNFRIFTINGGKTVAISGLTIANGYVSTDGGGIANFGSLTITGCAITDNYANGGGGILSFAILNMSDSTLSGNRAGFDGAGMYNINGSASLTNCTISANTSVGGGSGGIVSLAYSGFSASLSLTNCTVTGNSGSKIIDVYIYPGGIASTAQLRNTLVAGNSGRNFEFSGSAQVSSLGNNLDSDGTSGFTNGANGNLAGTAARKLNALLSELGNYGGTTQTHALLPGSPAINAGTSSGAPTSDQRGSSRVGAVDIGAFESQGFTLAFSGGNNQSAAVNTAFASPLAVMVAANVTAEPANGGQVRFTPPGSGASAGVAGSPATVTSGVATSGTLTANSKTGSYNVAASASGATAVNFSLTNSCSTITVIAPATNGGTAGAGFSQTFTQTGGIGTTTFSTASALPAGLTLSTGGLLSGIPTQTGTFPITVKATDSNGCMNTVGYTLSIGCQIITATAPAINSGTAGVGFSQIFAQSGGLGTITWSKTGALPTGITLSSDGALSGTPAQTGSFPITVKATDSNGCIGTVNYALTIGCQTITIGPASIAGGNPGVAYSQQFTQSGGIGTTTFSTSSTLPTGITLSSGGLLSGSTTQTGSFPITVKATDSNGCMGTASYTLTIGCPAITVTPPATSTGAAGISFSQTFTQTGGTAGTTFSTASMLPTGLALSSTGVLSGTPAQIGAFPITVTATSSGGCTGSANYVLTIGCPAITLSSLAAGTAGTAYNQTLTASPNGGSYSFAVTAGSLPPGLSLVAGGAITGTPTQAGAFNFTVTTTGFGSCTGSQAYSLVILCPAITLSPASLPNATANTAYSQTISATPSGTTYSFAVSSGALPTGLTLNSNGSFSGAPTQSGTFSFRITATGFGACTGYRDYTLVVGCSTITLSPSSLPGGNIGMAYNQNVSATPAGTYNYSVTNGVLPSGLTLNAGTGAISGTPTASGSFAFMITASASNCSGSTSYTVSIGCQTVSFSTTSLPTGTAGSSYSQPLAVTPSGTYTFSLVTGNLPNGLSLNATSGVISGVATVTGAYSFTVKAQTATGCSGTQAYSLAITCPGVALTPATLPSGTAGTAYSQTIAASPAGSAYSFAVTSGTLPTGLTLNATTGSLSGTPSAKGSFAFTITATGFGSCSGSQSYTVVIGGGATCPAISLPDSLPNGSIGTAYSNAVTASPSGSYGYVVTSSSLPPGLTLYAAAGLIFGYPTANGTYAFTITATDSNNCTGSKSYTVVIGGAGLQASTVNDFSGDRRSDFVLWRTDEAQWLIVDSATDKAQTTQWGQAGDVAVPGDYDGDGKADLAVFSKDGHWLIKLSKDGATVDKAWGGLGSDVPAPGDYDGDSQTDIAVWRGSEGNWYIARSSDGQTITTLWGAAYAPYRDMPVPADYDGDGKTDIAVFRQANGHWYVRLSSDGSVIDKAWGLGSDVPVAADYDGDGKADIAVWRGSEGRWYIVRSSDGAVETKVWGAAYAPYFDVPVPGDYDGDGKTDIAVWRPATGMWCSLNSSDGSVRTKQHGQAGAMPVTSRP